MAITADGKFLYTLDAGTGTIGIFGIQKDGALTSLGSAAGVVVNAGFNAIAAY